MFDQLEWLFFDIGSTLVDERAAYAHRFRDIASLAHVPYEAVYETAVRFYRQNQKVTRKPQSTLAFRYQNGIQKMRFYTRILQSVLSC